MAFLCPVRIRRGRKKKSLSGDVETKELRNNSFTGMGRITGSASIETLVRVGIEKENGPSPDSRMVVLHDFTPCIDDELQVKRGHVVNILYRENDWVYVISEDSRLQGFIPHSYCTPYNSHLGELALNNYKKKLPRDQNSNEIEVDLNIDPNHGDVSDNDSCNKKERSSTQQRLQQHDPFGRFVVLYTFIARDENDLSVEQGEFVTVLNREDPDWYWIIRSDGQEGFVPLGFVYPADVIQKVTSNLATAIFNHSKPNNLGLSLNSQTSGVTNSSSHITNTNPMSSSCDEEMRFRGTELVMLYDYKPQAVDDLAVRRGDWIYGDLNNQTADGWLWVYAPKSKTYGFIPKAYARPPAMTSL